MKVPVGSADVDRFRDLVARRFGLSLAGRRRAEVAAVLAERVAASAPSCAAYLDGLAGGVSAEELGALAAAVTVPETYFFRSPEQFHALAEAAVPDRMRARATTRRLRLLSMACATGEEAYSLGMATRDAITEPGWEVEILGVDLNPAALQVAGRGRYPEWSLRAMPPSLQRRWLRPEGSVVRVADEVLRSVRFMPGNLADPAADPAADAADAAGAPWQCPGGYDAIFCRNVLMYLTPHHARAAVDRLVASLAPGGFLFLGHAETGYGRTADVELRHTHHTFYFQRPGVPAVSAEPLPGWNPPASVAAKAPEPTWRPPTLAAHVAAKAPEPTWRPPTLAANVAAKAPEPTWRPPRLAANVAAKAATLALMRQERFADALALCEDAGTDAARDPDGALVRCVLLAQCGLLDRAEVECRRLLDVDGSDAGAHYLLAVCREGAGDRPAAELHARTAAYLDPGFALPRLRLGLLARRRGDVRTARDELGSALTLLAGEDGYRVLLFGGGFTRSALIELCRREWSGCGSAA